MVMEARGLRFGFLDMQVCVPTDWTDQQVEEFANRINPTGTEYPWKIRRNGSPYLRGALERVTCQEDTANVHIMLDC